VEYNLFPDEVEAPTDSAQRSAAPQNTPLTLAADEISFFSSEVELKDIAAGVALKGVPLDDVLKTICGGYGSKLEALKLKYEAAVTEIDEAIDEGKHRIGVDDARAASVRQKIENRRRELELLSARIERLEYVISAGLHEVRKKRFEHGREFFADQSKFLDEGARKSHEELLEDLKVQRELDDEIYKTQKQYWEADQKEFERRAQLWEKELALVETRLLTSRDRVSRLSDLGISRTTANFLIWVGYISMAGVGGVIGGFIQKRQNPNTDFLSIIFQGFFNLVKLAEPAQKNAGALSFIAAPLPFVLLVVVYMALLGAFVWGTDWVLRKFDPIGWGGKDKDKSKGKRRPRERSGLLERFSSYIPTPEVDRKSYRQLLAYFPYIVLASLIIWGLSAGITPPPSGSGATPPDPTHGLAATYLGVIFSLLSTSAAMLYATKVIEKRAQNTVAAGGLFGKYLRMNWEFGLLMLLMVAALFISAVLPVTPPPAPAVPASATPFDYNVLSLGATAIFMCLCSMGLAYGLIQRGLFREVDYLERWRLFHRQQIEKSRKGPTFHEVLEEYGTNEEIRNLLTSYRNARQMLDEARVLYELKEVFDGDFDDSDDPPLRKFLNTLWPSSDHSRFGKIKAAPPGEPRPIDYVVAPEATARVLINRVEKRSSQERSQAVAAELQRLEQESVELRNRLERLAQAQTVRRRQKLALTQEYERLRSVLAVGREKDVLKFQAAYGVGQLAHAELKDDLVPPKPPPPPIQPPITPTQVIQ
jgi:hypothetical protein